MRFEALYHPSHLASKRPNLSRRNPKARPFIAGLTLITRRVHSMFTSIPAGPVAVTKRKIPAQIGGLEG